MSQFSKIPKVNVPEPVFSISGFFRIFPDFNFLSQFLFEKEKFFIFVFCKNFYFFYIFIFYFFIFLLNSVQKKLSQFWKFPKVNVPEPAFSYYSCDYITECRRPFVFLWKTINQTIHDVQWWFLFKVTVT